MTLAALGAGLWPLPGWAQQGAAARAVVGLVTQAMEAGAKGQPVDADTLFRVKLAVARHSDIGTQARRAVAAYWDRMTVQQQGRYVALYETYVVGSLVRQLARLRITRFALVEERAINERETLVGIRVATADGRERLLHWRMREAEGEPRIVDVLEDGVSMADLHRSDFTAALAANRGDVDAFLGLLAERVTRLHR